MSVPVPKKSQYIQSNQLFVEPNGGRRFLADYEWSLLKDYVDEARSGEIDTDGVTFLVSYNLWDLFNDCLNEAAVTKLYMEHA